MEKQPTKDLRELAGRFRRPAFGAAVGCLSLRKRLLPNLDNHAERSFQIAQIEIFFQSVFAVEDQKGGVAADGKCTGMPGSAMQFEGAAAIHQKRARRLVSGTAEPFSLGGATAITDFAPPNGAKNCSERK